MRYAIVESGGKQYKAVEGEMLEVDRLPDQEGTQIGFERILMMADGPDFMIGTPTLNGVEVKATVVDHFSARKVTHFRYSPKKRIRVRGGHRQQYTRVSVDFIGTPGETRKPAKVEPKPEPAPSKEKPSVREAAGSPTKKAPGKSATKKTSGSGPARKKTSK